MMTGMLGTRHGLANELTSLIIPRTTPYGAYRYVEVQGRMKREFVNLCKATYADTEYSVWYGDRVQVCAE